MENALKAPNKSSSLWHFSLDKDRAPPYIDLAVDSGRRFFVSIRHDFRGFGRFAPLSLWVVLVMMGGCRHPQQPLDVRFSHHRETGSPPGALRRVANVLFDIVGFGRDARAAVPGADSAAGAYSARRIHYVRVRK